MYSILKTSDHYVTEFLVDEDADMADLPTSSVAPGSTCLVANTGILYVLNNAKEWKKIA